MNRLLVVGIAALALELAPLLSAEAAVHTPEQDTYETAKLLHPISDDEWKTVAGARVSEKYQIIKGDTLFDVSKRLFGDARYWPKLYALNNDTITNPHNIRPGNSIAFIPGTGTSLPAVSVASNDGAPGGSRSDAPAARAKPSGPRSLEWRALPRQNWEGQDAKLPDDVDALGFAKDIHVANVKPRGFDIEAIAASQRIASLGQIIGSRSSGEYLTLGDTVYIRADEDIQVGETYAITQEPAVLKSRKSERNGLSYPILGRVKIIGVRDNQFIGSIISGRGFIYRGTSLIHSPVRIPQLTPIPAETSTEGVIMVDRNFATYTVAQHKQVYVDRGSADGVKPGMIFRAYEHYDPSNEKKITGSDYIIDADLMVIQVSERFSAALIINSLVPINENSTAVLLTDVSDLLHNRGFREKDLNESHKDNELDELDKLDAGAGLGKDEQRELEQLENWKGNPPPGQTPPEPPAPTDAAPPATAPPAAAEPPGDVILNLPPPASPSSEETPPPPPPPAAEAPPATAPVSSPPAAEPSAATPPAPSANGASDESKALDGLLNQ